MAGDALSRDGEAVARGGEALAAAASSGCCCGRCTRTFPPVPCPAPPCIDTGILPYLINWRNNQPTVVYQSQNGCCWPPTFHGRARYIVRDFDDQGCERFFNRWDLEWTELGLTGTHHRIDRTGPGCAVAFDQTTPINLPPPQAFLHPLDPTLWHHGGMTNGVEMENCFDALFVGRTEHGTEPGHGFTLYDARSQVTPGPGACPTNRPPMGACCCNSICHFVTAAECAGMNGQYHGDGSSCLDVNCAGPGGPELGSCCRPNGSCFNTDAITCSLAQGTFRANQTCITGPPCPAPPVWACCLPDHSCAPLTQAACLAQNGTWNPNQNCAQVNCLPNPQTGACCYPIFPGVECQQLTQAQCDQVAGGEWHGPNTECQTEPCQGACCYRDSRGQLQCTQSLAAECAGLGQPGTSVFLGYGTSCSPFPCGSFGLQGNTITQFQGSRSFF